MIYLAAGALIVWLGAVAYRRSPGVHRGRWRVGAGLLASVLLAAGAFLCVRGAYVEGAVAVFAALVLAGMTRSDRNAKARPNRPAGGMTAEEARSILGVRPGDGAETVQAAYTRLMRLAHPDKGGTTGLAAQLNAARDRLLKK
jgi:hypothetical protein